MVVVLWWVAVPLNGHFNDKCEVKAAKCTPQCVNCWGAHPAWSASCPVQWEASAHTQRVFETHPVAFTVPQAQEGSWETVSCCKRYSTTGKGTDRWNRVWTEAPRGPWL